MRYSMYTEIKYISAVYDDEYIARDYVKRFQRVGEGVYVNIQAQ